MSASNDMNDHDSMSDSADSADSGSDMESYDSDAISSSDSSYGMTMRHHGGDILDMLRADERTPRQRFDGFLENIRAGTKVFKITDQCVLDYNLVGTSRNDNNSQSGEEEEQLAVAAVAVVEQQPLLVRELVDAVSSRTNALTHCILGHEVFRLLGAVCQSQLLPAVTAHESLLFLKLGTDHSMQPGILDTPAILNALIKHATPQLAEMEFRGFALASTAQVQQLAQIVAGRTHILRQLNLLGIQFPTTLAAAATITTNAGFLDPLLAALQTVEPLDEVRCIGLGTAAPHSLVTVTALSNLLTVKKKWWRLVLDNMGLDDGHCQCMVQLFSRDDTCKAGDLLSVMDNPAISLASFKAMAALFFRKRRMGAVKLDNGGEWDAKFDLVRSMNNVHCRLDHILGDQGAYRNRFAWSEWLAKLNAVGWEDEKHKLNYVWFTLLEKPDFCYQQR